MYTKRVARILTASVIALAMVLAGIVSVGSASAASVGTLWSRPTSGSSRQPMQASILSAQDADIDILWFNANYGEGAPFYKSENPINKTVTEAVYGLVVQTLYDGGTNIAASCTDDRYAAGSGVAYSTSFTVGELERIAVLGDFSTYGTGVFNLWFDTGGDGDYFEFDVEGKMTGLDGDKYALCQEYPADGERGFIIDGDTRFSIVPDGGAYTLSQIAAGDAPGISADTEVAFWVGVWDSKADEVPMEMDLWDVRANPSLVKVDAWLSSLKPDLAEGDLFDDGYGNLYVYGYDLFDSIQEAIDKVCSEGLVLVYPGTYDEKITIEKSVWLWGDYAGDDWPVISPTSPVNAVVTVSGADVDAVIDGFTIQGPFQVDSSESFLAGIFVREGAYCQISNNRLLDVRDSEVLSGTQRGLGIIVGRQAYSTTGLALIEGNIVEGYQKGGIVVDNAGSEAVVTGNIVRGHGKTPVTAQNGIQISRGAEATVAGNTVEGNWYTGEGWSAAGILLYQAGDTTATDNTLNANQIAIYTDNHWSFPGVLDNEFGTSDYANELNVAVDTTDWSAPSEVWVDPSYSEVQDGDVVGEHIKGYDAFASIQEAVSAAAEHAEVHVEAGEYTLSEPLSLTKEIHLLGPNAGVDPNSDSQSRVEEAVIKGTVRLEAAAGDNVTIDGFNFLDDQTGRNFIAVYLLGSGDYEVTNCVFERDTAKTSDELVSEDFMIRAIHIGPASCGAAIENNLFTGSDVNVYRNSSWRSAIWSDGVGSANCVEIQNNVFDTNRTGLNLDNEVDNITLRGNKFLRNGTHISLGGSPVLTGEYAISGNEFSLAGAVFNLSGVDSGFRLDATDNKYDVSAPDSLDDAKTPDEMSLEELFILESVMYHKGKAGRQGLARIIEDTVFVTSFSGTIQQAIDVADLGDAIELAAGEYDEAFAVDKAVTIRGRGADGTVIKPSALLQTGVGHKYDTDMAVAVFVNGAGSDDNVVAIEDLTIDGNGGTLQGDAVVFWNNSIGSLDRVKIQNTRPFSGVQTGQGIAVDAGAGETAELTVNYCSVDTFNKNGIDVVNGNGASSGGGDVTVNVIGGSITGRGSTEVIAQNGILFWERAGGSVGGSVDGVAISGFDCTLDTAEATGILLYQVLNGDVDIANVDFSSSEQYICLAAETDDRLELVDCTFDDIAPASASRAELEAIEDKIGHAMDDMTVGVITFKPDTFIVTTNTRGIQAAVDAAQPGDTIMVSEGTYQENVVIPGGKNGLRLVGSGSESTSIAPVTGTALRLQGYPAGAYPAATRPISNVIVQGFTLESVDGCAFLALSSTPDSGPYTTDLELSDIVVDGSMLGIVLNAVDGVNLTGVNVRDIEGAAGALELTGVSDLTFTDGSLEDNDVAVRLQATGEGDVGEDYGPNQNLVFHGSSFVGNAVAIQNQDSGTTIDSALNWWGDIGGPTETIEGNVSYDPWYLDDGMTLRSDELTLEVTVTGNGSVTVNPDKDQYEYGDEVTLTAIPASGCAFRSWSGHAAGNALGITITMDGNKAIAAEFAERSTYEFTYSVPDDIVAGEANEIAVTFEPDGISEVGYDSVRFNVNVTKPDVATVSLMATDTNGVEHDIAAIGYWGPSDGFTIGADYSATTPVRATFSDPGTYTITFSLVDMSNGQAVIVSETETVAVRAPAHSTYKFTYTVPEDIVAGEENELSVLFGSEQIMELGYDAVRFNVSVTKPDGATVNLMAEDTNHVWHDMAAIGYWGPSSGFPIGAAYSAMTPVRATFSDPGTYTITFSLVDMVNGQAVIVSETETVTVKPVPEPSTYKFTYTVPSPITEDREYSIDVTLQPDTVNQLGYDLVRFNVSVTKPSGATVTLKATDANNVEYDIAIIGYWGPEGGFPILKDYSATTPVKAVFSAPGTYTIMFSLVDMTDNQKVISTATETLTVRRAPTSDDDGPSGPSGGGGVLPPVIAPSVTETIDTTSGGTVELEDGSASVTLPPNATEEDVTVTLSPVTEVTQPTTGMVMIGGKIYEITAETDAGDQITQFSQPLTLTFTFTEEELDESEADLDDLKVFYWDEDAGAWIALPTTVDSTTGTVTALTDHFTVFALMAKSDMPELQDIPGHWAETYILRLVSLGVVGGYEDGTYRPEAGITRQEFAKMVVLAAGLEPDAEPALTFSDNDQIADWAKGYVSAAVKAGIITGLDGNRFGPTEPVTRAQAATMIMRALGIAAASTETTFADAETIPSWAQAAIQAAVDKAIITGFEDNTFRPGLNATRAQAAKMLSRLTEVRFEQ